jgi:hypothetical protein
MFSAKDMYQVVKEDSSLTIGALSSYLWIWILASSADESARKGPITWLFDYLTGVGVMLPEWVKKVLLSPRPDMLVLMVVFSLSLAYCAQLAPAVLILAIEWHGLSEVWTAYVVCLLVLSLVTAFLAKIGKQALTPGYAVTAKVLVPGIMVLAYPFLALMGMFEKFTMPRNGPDIPSDWDLLDSTPLEKLTGADLARVLRVAKDDAYVIPPKRRPPVEGLPPIGRVRDSA